MNSKKAEDVLGRAGNNSYRVKMGARNILGTVDDQNLSTLSWTSKVVY